MLCFLSSGARPRRCCFPPLSFHPILRTALWNENYYTHYIDNEIKSWEWERIELGIPFGIEKLQKEKNNRQKAESLKLHAQSRGSKNVLEMSLFQNFVMCINAYLCISYWLCSKLHVISTTPFSPHSQSVMICPCVCLCFSSHPSSMSVSSLTERASREWVGH